MKPYINECIRQLLLWNIPPQNSVSWNNNHLFLFYVWACQSRLDPATPSSSEAGDVEDWVQVCSKSRSFFNHMLPGTYFFHGDSRSSEGQALLSRHILSLGLYHVH